MAVSIRLRREGAKNRPYYKVVVADSRSPRDGKFIEIIGTYDPKKPDHNSTLKLDRIEHWISQGRAAVRYRPQLDQEKQESGLQRHRRIARRYQEREPCSGACEGRDSREALRSCGGSNFADRQSSRCCDRRQAMVSGDFCADDKRRIVRIISNRQ